MTAFCFAIDACYSKKPFEIPTKTPLDYESVFLKRAKHVQLRETNFMRYPSSNDTYSLHFE